MEDEPMQRVTVSLPAWALDWARQEGRGNVGAGLRRLLEELDQRQGMQPWQPPPEPLDFDVDAAVDQALTRTRPTP